MHLFVMIETLTLMMEIIQIQVITPLMETKKDEETWDSRRPTELNLLEINTDHRHVSISNYEQPE